MPLMSMAGKGEAQRIRSLWPNESALLREAKELGISQLFSG